MVHSINDFKSIENEMLLHFTLTIKYRFQKSVHLANENYPHFKVGSGVRKPIEIINHMTHVLLYALQSLNHKESNRIPTPSIQNWQEEIKRFESTIFEIAEILRSIKISTSIKKVILQGPLSDVMTHIGQLSMMSRMSGTPLPKENFMKAAV